MRRLPVELEGFVRAGKMRQVDMDSEQSISPSLQRKKLFEPVYVNSLKNISPAPTQVTPNTPQGNNVSTQVLNQSTRRQS